MEFVLFIFSKLEIRKRIIWTPFLKIYTTMGFE